MASGRDTDITSLKTERVIVGNSSIIGVTLVSGQLAVSVKYFSGGSLEIGGASLTWGAGWLLGTSEIFNFDGAGTFYLASSGTTAIAMVARGRTQGN